MKDSRRSDEGTRQAPRAPKQGPGLPKANPPVLGPPMPPSDGGGGGGGRRAAAPSVNISDLFDKGTPSSVKMLQQWTAPAEAESKPTGLSATALTGPSSGSSGQGSGTSTPAQAALGRRRQAAAQERAEEISARTRTLSLNPEMPAKVTASAPTMVMGRMVSPGIQTVEEAPEPEKARKAEEMTWDRYNSLSETQRAAVDFNTLLVKAREKDLKTDYEPNSGANREYHDAVEKMFGDKGHSRTYAPETMAVLQQIGWKPEKVKTEFDDFNGNGVMGDDLDDFLNLEVAIDAKQLDKGVETIKTDLLDIQVASGGLTPVQKQLAAHTSDLQEQMAKSGQVLQSFQAAAAMTRSDITARWGGTENKVNINLGFGTGQPDTEFQTIFELYSDKDYEQKNGRSMEEGLQILRQGLEQDGKLDDFMKYAERRSGQAAEFQLPLGSQMRVNYRTPEEFRKILGFEQES